MQWFMFFFELQLVFAHVTEGGDKLQYTAELHK